MDDDNTHTLSSDRKSQISSNPTSKRGGWITFPFIIGAVGGLAVAGSGWIANLIVYLIQEFNVKNINAAQISNVANGLMNLSPIIWAVIADSFLGTFSVVSISSCASLLGIVLLTLTATLNFLRPQACDNRDGPTSCQPPNKLQYAVIYVGIALAAIGQGGARITIMTVGANQHKKPKDQGVFFNWYFFTLYSAYVISLTAIVYTQDNVSWGWGFGLCLGANFIGLASFLLGSRYYRHDKPQGSPFTALARVIVSTLRKRKVKLSSSANDEDYYYGPDGFTKLTVAPPRKSFGFFNHAALKIEGDVHSDGSVAKPWRLCTVQEVEDFKTLIRIFPLWSSSIFLGTPLAIQSSLIVLQALVMNRHLTHHFQIPAGSFLVVVMISTSLSLALMDCFLYPNWEKLSGRPLTPLQRIALGHALTVVSMATSAVVEIKRLRIAHDHHLQAQPGSTVPMSALWLIPQLVLAGIGEAFHLPGQVALYYQEFPMALRSTSSATVAMLVGIAFYMSTALIDLIRRVTGWLPDDINHGRLDNVYWMLVVVGVANFGYYMFCAKCYKYQNVEKRSVPVAGSHSEK